MKMFARLTLTLSIVATQATAAVSAQTACPSYPISIAQDAGAKAQALSELGAISPTATLAWSDARGTVQNIDGMALDLACADDAPLSQAIATVVARAPALFQMDLKEWDLPGISCGAITSQTHFYKAFRARMGGYAVLQDTATFLVRRIDGALVLSSVYAVYLPPVSSATAHALENCVQRPQRALEHKVLSKRYQYTYYLPKPADMCQVGGVASYFPRWSDTLEVDPTPSLQWFEGEHSVELRKTFHATVHVAEKNQTARLINSDATCTMWVDDTLTRLVGFRATLDAVTGAWLDALPGASPYCTTCLAGLAPSR